MLYPQIQRSNFSPANPVLHTTALKIVMIVRDAGLGASQRAGSPPIVPAGITNDSTTR